MTESVSLFTIIYLHLLVNKSDFSKRKEEEKAKEENLQLELFHFTKCNCKSIPSGTSWVPKGQERVTDVSSLLFHRLYSTFRNFFFLTLFTFNPPMARTKWKTVLHLPLIQLYSLYYYNCVLFLFYVLFRHTSSSSFWVQV